MPINPKQAREALGFSQTEMAKAMGVSRGSWLKWERGERELTAAPSRMLKTLLWLQSENMLDKYFKLFSNP